MEIKQTTRIFATLTLILLMGSTLLVTSARADKLETQTTKTGAVFTLDRSNPYLGEAWKDPSGLIWGDIARKRPALDYFCYEVKEGEVCNMSHEAAITYCRIIGGRLPTVREFAQLGVYMGAAGIRSTDAEDYYSVNSGMSEGEYIVDFYYNDTGYSPHEWFPNLTYTNNDRTLSISFYSSRVHPLFTNDAYVYWGSNAILTHARRENRFNNVSVRCVMSR